MEPWEAEDRSASPGSQEGLRYEDWAGSALAGCEPFQDSRSVVAELHLSLAAPLIGVELDGVAMNVMRSSVRLAVVAIWAPDVGWSVR